MEERYHVTTENWFYPDMSNVNKNITVEAKLISPPTYFESFHPMHFYVLDVFSFTQTKCTLFIYYVSTSCSLDM